MKEKNKLSLRSMLILMVLVPMVVAIVGLAVSSITVLSSKLSENTLEELMVAAKGLEGYYRYDLEHDNNLVDGFVEYNPEEYIDEFYNKTGVNLTLFKDNIRYMTSLRNDKGERNEGTESSADVWAAVKSGKDYSSTSVVIGGIDYYVYYLPLKDGKGNVVGMSFAGKPATQIQEAQRNIMLLIGGISLVLVIIFVAIAFMIAKKVANPIKAAAENIQKLSNGEVNIRLDAKSNIQETTVLIESTNSLTGALKNIVGKIHGSMDNLYGLIGSTTNLATDSSHSTTQISEAMSGLSKATELMAESVQDINSNVIEMGNIVEDTQSTVSTLAASSENMEKANKGAMECIDNVISSSEKTVEAVQEITESINNTNDAVIKISDMVNLITEIAGQTNLLALNASIEAARAGEFGKGFSVVADNIKELAAQSGDSANEIKVIVEEISALSKTCVEQADAVKTTIEEERDLLGEAKTQFNTLNDEITSSIDNIQTVENITAKLGDIKSTIVSAITDLSAVSEETSATNQEVSASASLVAGNVNDVSSSMGDMSSSADDLKVAISFFKE